MRLTLDKKLTENSGGKNRVSCPETLRWRHTGYLIFEQPLCILLIRKYKIIARCSTIYGIKILCNFENVLANNVYFTDRKMDKLALFRPKTGVRKGYLWLWSWKLFQKLRLIDRNNLWKFQALVSRNVYFADRNMLAFRPFIGRKNI